jgi:hypothetical protein
MVRIGNAEETEGFKVRLEFTDGTGKEAAREPYLRGPIFDPIRNDPCLFRSLKVDHG